MQKIIDFFVIELFQVFRYTINVTILKELLSMNLKSKLEDITFSVIQHLPVVPSFLMNWTDNYLSRRIAELEHETIRQQWDKASLEKALSEIHERQQDIEKH